MNQFWIGAFTGAATILFVAATVSVALCGFFRKQKQDDPPIRLMVIRPKDFHKKTG